MKSTDVKSLRAIPDAPTFYPSEAEFKDLYAYLQKIHTEGEAAGICVIVPPPGWRPPFCLPDIKFRTRQQDLSSLHGGVREARAFERRVRLCHALHGRPLPTILCIAVRNHTPPSSAASTRVPAATEMQWSAPICLYSLHRAVADLGGYSAVEDTAQWSTVASALSLDDAAQKAATGCVNFSSMQHSKTTKVDTFPMWAEAVRTAFRAWLLPVIGPCASAKDPLPLMGTYASYAEAGTEAFTDGIMLAPRIQVLATEPDPPPIALPEDKIPLQLGTRFWRYWPNEGRCFTGVILDMSTKGRSFTVEYEEIANPELSPCTTGSNSNDGHSDSNTAESESGRRLKQQVALRSSSRVQPRAQGHSETLSKSREQLSKWELAVLVANGASPAEAKECHMGNICSRCLVVGEPVNRQDKGRRPKVDKALQDQQQQQAMLVCAGCSDKRHRRCLDSNEVKDLRASTSIENRNSQPLELVREANAVQGAEAQGGSSVDCYRSPTVALGGATRFEVDWFCRPCLRAAAKSAVTSHRKATAATTASTNTPDDARSQSKSSTACAPSQVSLDSIQKSSKEARLSAKRSSKGSAVSADEAVDGGCGNFGFSDGPKHSLSSFRRQAHEWRELYFGKDMNSRSSLSSSSSSSSSLLLSSPSLGYGDAPDASSTDLAEAEEGLRAAAAAAHDAAAEGWSKSSGCDNNTAKDDTEFGRAAAAADRVPTGRHLTRSGCLALEAEFWRLVEGRSHRLEQCRNLDSNSQNSADELSKLTHVVYGSDLDSSLHGSGFPTDRYVSGPAWIPEDLNQDVGAASSEEITPLNVQEQPTMAAAVASNLSSTPSTSHSKLPPCSMAPPAFTSSSDSVSQKYSSSEAVDTAKDATNSTQLSRTRGLSRKALFSKAPLSSHSTDRIGISKRPCLKRAKLISNGGSIEAGTATTVTTETPGKALRATEAVTTSQSRKKSMRWACEVCTLMNPACRVKCDACRSLRPSEPIAPLEKKVGEERSASLEIPTTTAGSASRTLGRRTTSCIPAPSHTLLVKGTLKKPAAKLSGGAPVAAERSAVEYCKSAWNLTTLPTASGSLLQLLGADISGVVVPWLYVGGPFSSFCWHNEDHHMYSINYHHMGAPKVWYGVAGADAQRFEERAAEIAPLLCAHAPDLWLRVVTLLSPSALNGSSRDRDVTSSNQDYGASDVDGNGNEAGIGSTTNSLKKKGGGGVRVVRALHRAGTYVVTFPAAYHAGFNTGFNVAEAVNFATPLWLPWGRQALKVYSNLRRAPVFAHDALVLAVVRALLPDFCPERGDTTDTSMTRSSRNQSKRRRSNSSGSSVSYSGELLQAAADAAAEWTASQNLHRIGQSSSSAMHSRPPLALQAALAPAIQELQSMLHSWRQLAVQTASWAVQCADADLGSHAVQEEASLNSQDGCSAHNTGRADGASEEGLKDCHEGLQVVESMAGLVAAAAASKGISTRANRGSVRVAYECTHTNGGAVNSRMAVARSGGAESDSHGTPDVVAAKATAANLGKGIHSTDTPVLTSVFGRSSAATVSGVACDCCLAYCFVAAVRCRTCTGVGCNVEHLVKTCATRCCLEADATTVGAARPARDRRTGEDNSHVGGHHDFGLGSEVANALGRGPCYDFVSRGPYHEALQLLHALQIQKALANN